MIAADLTGIPVQRIRDGVMAVGVDIFCQEILQGMLRLGKEQDFALIITKAQAPYMAKIFPEYRRCILPFPYLPLYWLTRVIEKITKGRNSGFNMISRLMKPFKYLALLRLERRVGGLDVLWCPYATPGTTYRTPMPVVYTIHDLIPFHDPAASEKTRTKYRKMLDRAYLTTISAYVRDEIAANCQKTADEIAVIPNAVTVTTQQQPVEGLQEKRYILDINAYANRKNPMTLLRAYEQIAQQTGLDLVFCGYDVDGYIHQFRAVAEKSPFADRLHVLSGVSAPQRNWLLRQCAVFVTPSLDEGFGRTPVEAAICQVPVLSTKCTSLLEATQGLVHYVDDPLDPDEYAQKLLDMISTPDPQTKLADIAQRLRSEYSIENCAAKYWNLFQNVIEKERKPHVRL